jgi:NADH-quinone oxidoreductase subunit L
MTTPFWYVGLIPLLPGLGALVNGVFGRRFSKRVIHTIACGTTLASCLLAVVLLVQFVQYPPEARHFPVTYYDWLDIGPVRLPTGESARLHVPVELLVDPLSVVMVLVVTFVGFLIHVYSTGYMWEDPDYARYFSYLNLFMFAMLTLALSSSFLLLFVGWEGVGLCSYLLIGFWADRTSAANAGKKAFLVNRIGDLGFLLGMMLVFLEFGSLRFDDVFPRVVGGAYGVNDPILVAIGLLLLTGVTGKSAQIPLYVWLPDAMEGPTPVSALIHAATMVTAGVYLIVRCNALYQMAPDALGVVAVIGAVTALFAATIGTAQTDIKRVLAYSTVSQLGYMVLAAGVGAFTAAIFHLVTHAFFKALLFLGAGSVIHALHHEQDMRRMGGLRRYLPTTFKTMTMGVLAIAGMPLFSGFFSKDEILLQTFVSPYGHSLLWALGTVTAGLTAFYMFRLWFLTFFGPERMDEHTRRHIHESPPNMTIPLRVLAVLSVVGGVIGLPAAFFHLPVVGTLLHPLEAIQIHRFLEPSIARVPTALHGTVSHEAGLGLELLLMLASVGAGLVGFLVAYFLYYRRPELPDRVAAASEPLYTLVRNKYYVDEIYDALVVRPLLGLANLLTWLDVHVVDGLVNGAAWLTRTLADLSGRVDFYGVDGVVNGVAEGVRQVGGALRRAHTGLAQQYVFGAVVLALFLLLFYMLVF